MITVAIIEDHARIRTNLQQYLQEEPNLICDLAVNSVENFIGSVDVQQAPDVILLDIGLPGISGIQGIPMIKSTCPKSEIIILTVHDESSQVFDALCAGASGYLLKEASLAQICEAISIVHGGGSVMTPKIARKITEYFNKRPSPPKISDKDRKDLSERERDIVAGLVDGLSYKLIAHRYNISLDTVRSHIKNIYGKLHINSKVELVTRSLRGDL